ncbi:MAG: pbpE 1 [Verrucomicrobia bacterium]|nr:pbpE 1 [Verrucomicrobiota bacterium]
MPCYVIESLSGIDAAFHFTNTSLGNRSPSATILHVKTPSRREFIKGVALAGLAASAAPTLLAHAAESKHPLSSFDDEMESFMKARQVPGGSLAIVKDGKLIYARGYGLADREKNLPVQADSLFRIASISKPFTAVGILKLVEQGKLKLDDKALELLKLPEKPLDPRWEDITVRHLLHHTGGWDRDAAFDPMFRPGTIATNLNVEAPAKPEHIIRYMLARKLDSAPGERYAYSNFGYCILGRIIEKLTKQDYETYMKEAVLAPIGIKRMQIGKSVAGQQAKGEVKYYMPDKGTADSVFPAIKRRVPWPYGGFYLEAMDAHGAWIASAVDLVRFASAFDDVSKSPLLKKESIREMFSPPAAPVSRTPEGKLKDSYYALGWQVRPVGREGKSNTWHSGSLPGTSTLLVRRWDGLDWAVLFNQRSKDSKLPDGAIDGAMHKAAGKVTEWPKEDLFPKFA